MNTSAMHSGDVRHENGVLTMVRHFDAPRELVFRMWTEAEHFMRWFGPSQCSVPHCTVDARPGGVMHFCVQVPEGEGEFAGQKVWGKWIFREIVAPERIVFDDTFSDADGNTVVRPGFPEETVISLFFEVHEGGTRMTLRNEGLDVDHGEIQGWSESFDELVDYLRSMQPEHIQHETIEGE